PRSDAYWDSCRPKGSDIHGPIAQKAIGRCVEASFHPAFPMEVAKRSPTTRKWTGSRFLDSIANSRLAISGSAQSNSRSARAPHSQRARYRQQKMLLPVAVDADDDSIRE